MMTRNKNNLLLSLFSLAGILMIIFLIMPVLRSIKGISKEIISQKKEIRSLEEQVRDLNEFRSNEEKIRSGLDKANLLFANPGAPIGFISFLENLSNDCRLKLRISPGPVIKGNKKTWPSLIFSLSLTGSFPDFLRFLEKLESGPHIVEIQNINIKRVEKGASAQGGSEGLPSAGVRASLSLKVFSK